MNKKRQQLKYNNSLLAINRSTINHSTAKRLNTFSKAERFSTPQLPPYIHENHRTEPSYELHKTSRFPTIPRAERVFYFDKQKQLEPGPSPDAYNVKYSDEVWRINHQGNTIGKRNRSQRKQSKPGPCDYEKPQMLKKSFNRSFTFYRSQRELDQHLKEKGKDSPGPIYEINTNFLAHKTKGRTAVFGSEKRKLDTTHRKIVAPKTQRFDTSMLEKQLIAAKQATKRATYRTIEPRQTTRCTFAHRKAQRVKSESPGPAAYAYFSQFSGWK